MLDQNVTTLLAAALGGALALIGGIVATYFTQMLNNGDERRRFVREKCEEVYILADQVKCWADNENLKWWYDYHKQFEPENHWEIDFCGSKIELKSIDCPIDRLMMIAALHIPELREKTQALKNVVDIYQSFLDYFPEQEWQAFSGEVDLILRDTDQKLKDAYLELKLFIEKTVLKNWRMWPLGDNNRTKNPFRKNNKIRF